MTTEETRDAIKEIYRTITVALERIEELEEALEPKPDEDYAF